MGRKKGDKASKMRNPKTIQEWREAVNAAAFMRAIYDCQLYGLITGPQIDAARCDEILEEGERRGFKPEPLSHLIDRCFARQPRS